MVQERGDSSSACILESKTSGTLQLEEFCWLASAWDAPLKALSCSGRKGILLEYQLCRRTYYANHTHKGFFLNLTRILWAMYHLLISDVETKSLTGKRMNQNPSVFNTKKQALSDRTLNFQVLSFLTFHTVATIKH